MTLIRSSIRALLRAAEPELERALRAVLERDDDYHAAGKPSCDWEDAAAREALVDALARDAHAVLRRLDGYKGHISIDPDSEIIVATEVTSGTDELEEGREHRCDVLVDAIVHRDEERVEVIPQERDLGPIVLAQAADHVGDTGLFERRDQLSLRSRAEVDVLGDRVERVPVEADRVPSAICADAGNKASLWKGSRASCGEAAAAVQLLALEPKLSTEEAARVRSLFSHAMRMLARLLQPH